jgi:hypothetical protein
VEGSCEHGIEPSASIKCWEVLEGLHNLAAPREGLSSVSRQVSLLQVVYIFEVIKLKLA